MERNIDINEISDGKRYGLEDMAKVECNGCKDCSACCCGMGNSIVLDPYDVYRLTTGLNCKFEELLIKKVDLNVVDGIILPNLKMEEENDSCTFLDENGRCSIHALRPGMCRIFPLGRIYENGSFQYFLQVNECKKKDRTKMKVKKWIDTPDMLKNEMFINQWHYFLKDLTNCMPDLSEGVVKQINMYILNVFYITLYQGSRDFYEQFEERLKIAKQFLKEMIG